MSITAYITVLAFGLSQSLPLESEKAQSLDPKTGIWVSTCLGGKVLLDFGTKDEGETPLLPNDVMACHAICRKVGSKIKIVPLAN